MSKSCCFAFVLAAICLSVILQSFEADAQPTIDETVSCGSSATGEVANMFRVIASSQQENAEKISDVKELLESKTVDCDSAQPSKQALVSALVGEFLVSFMPALSSSPITIDVHAADCLCISSSAYSQCFFAKIIMVLYKCLLTYLVNTF